MRHWWWCASLVVVCGTGGCGRGCGVGWEGGSVHALLGMHSPLTHAAKEQLFKKFCHLLLDGCYKHTNSMKTCSIITFATY